MGVLSGNLTPTLGGVVYYLQAYITHRGSGLRKLLPACRDSIGKLDRDTLFEISNPTAIVSCMHAVLSLVNGIEEMKEGVSLFSR